MTEDDSPRYAVYFAPGRDSAFWRFGCAWLGRDPETDEQLHRPSLSGPAAADWSDETVEAVTRAPAGYGFHGTLKPPFRLADGQSLDGLRTSFDDFADGRRAFDCESVAVQPLGRFIAFRITSDAAAMNALAADVVAHFDGFRRPAAEAELAKRRAAGLSARQDALLVEWGYPYVFDEFRFHMTLTGSIGDDGKRERLASSLRSMAQAQGAEGRLHVDGLALYEQPGTGRPFRLIHRRPFSG